MFKFILEGVKCIYAEIDEEYWEILEDKCYQFYEDWYFQSGDDVEEWMIYRIKRYCYDNDIEIREIWIGEDIEEE